MGGHSCGGRHGVDKNVRDAKLADTSESDYSDDEAEQTSTIEGTTGDPEGTAEGELKVFD